MAIYQRDRDFYQYFSEVEIDVLPLKFIKDITCYLGDGSSIVLDEKDFATNHADSDLENLIKNLDFYEHMTDIKIRIDYEKAEKDVVFKVSKILKDK